jgi:predicted molibdopterin-dependent oxidoreductase YjgC
MTKYQLSTFPEKCAGCLRCQLACSEVYTRAFNPSAARIRVEISGADCTMAFSEECNQCGICADHCFYEALVKKPLEAEP